MMTNDTLLVKIVTLLVNMAFITTKIVSKIAQL